MFHNEPIAPVSPVIFFLIGTPNGSAPSVRALAYFGATEGLLALAGAPPEEVFRMNGNSKNDLIEIASFKNEAAMKAARAKLTVSDSPYVSVATHQDFKRLLKTQFKIELAKAKGDARCTSSAKDASQTLCGLASAQVLPKMTRWTNSCSPRAKKLLLKKQTGRSPIGWRTATPKRQS